MIDFFFLVPIAIGLGLAGLASFMWTLRNGQYDDLEGAAQRILFEDHDGPDCDDPDPVGSTANEPHRNAERAA